MVTYITAYIVVYSSLYSIQSQSLHGGDSSECIEASPKEKHSRMTLHYIMQNDSARDLVLPPMWYLQFIRLWKL